MEFERCFVYESSHERPAKKPRRDWEGLSASLKLRKQTYRALWDRQRQLIDDVIGNVNAEVLDRINRFVSCANRDEHDSRLPTGLVVTGPGTSSHSSLFNQIFAKVTSQSNSVVVLLSSTEAPNLRTLLKNIIKKITSLNDNEDDEDTTGQPSKVPRLLNYDLRNVYDWCQSRKVEKVILAFQDSEAFDADILTETLQLLNAWLDRIPFVLLFGLATSVDLFQDRLPQAAKKYMHGESFDAANAEETLERVFERALTGAQLKLQLGPTLFGMLIQRQKDHIQTIDSFTNAIKYAYMSHFYANPLSVFLADEVKLKSVNAEHFEAIRNLPSFRRHAESLLETGEATQVRKLLDNDRELFAKILETRQKLRVNTSWLLGALRTISTLQWILEIKPAIRFSDLYLRGISGQLQESSIIRELLLFVRKSSSDKLIAMLQPIVDLLMTMPPGEIDVSPDDFRDIQEELAGLLKGRGASKQPLRSDYGLGYATFETTLVGKKMALSKRKLQVSKQDKAYSKLVQHFQDLLASYFNSVLSRFDRTFLHEIFTYDLKSPHRDVFMPKSRFAVERALSTPHDYLGCSCCAATNGLSPTLPSTAILYQLYLESGALINAFDLWSAFRAMVDDQHDNEQTTMALFYRALAELKHLGFLKPSRKKADHLAKLTWKGL